MVFPQWYGLGLKLSDSSSHSRRSNSKSPCMLAHGRPATASNDIPQSATIYNSFSTTTCTYVDTFDIVHELLDCIYGCAKHPDKICDLTLFVSRMTKYRNFPSIVSLRSHSEIHNNNKSFSMMSQSQSIGWVKQKPGDNCQTTRIVTKCFVHVLGPPGTYSTSLITMIGSTFYNGYNVWSLMQSKLPTRSYCKNFTPLSGLHNNRFLNTSPLAWVLLANPMICRKTWQLLTTPCIHWPYPSTWIPLERKRTWPSTPLPTFLLLSKETKSYVAILMVVLSS